MKYKIGKNQTSKSFVVGAGTDPENLQRVEQKKGGVQVKNCVLIHAISVYLFKKNVQTVPLLINFFIKRGATRPRIPCPWIRQ